MPRFRLLWMSGRISGVLLAAALLAACVGEVVPATPVVRQVPAVASSAPVATALPPTTTLVPPTPAIPAVTPAQTADNLSRLRELRTIGEGGVNNLALAPDGSFLAIGTTAGWGLYALPSLRRIRFELIGQDLPHFIWSADSRLLAVSSALQNSSTIYRMPDGASIGHVQSVAADFSPDGKLFASLIPRSSMNGRTSIVLPSSVEFTRLDTSVFSATITEYSTDGSAIFSPDSQLIATTLGGDSLLWKLGTPVERGPLAQLPGTSPLFSPNGRILATIVVSDTATKVRLWNVPSGRALATLVVTNTAVYPSLSFRDDDTLLAVLPGRQLQTWSIRQARRVATIPLSSSADALSADGQVLISYPGGDAMNSQGIRFTRIADGHVLYEDLQVVLYSGPPDSVAVSADGATIAYGSPSGLVRVVDLRAGSTQDIPTTGYYFAATFSPDGKTLAALAYSSQVVTLWHVDDSTFVQQLMPTDAAVRSPNFAFERLEFAPDGRSLVATGYEYFENMVNVVAISWDLTGGGAAHKLWNFDGGNDGAQSNALPLYRYSPASHAAAWAGNQGIHIQPASGSAITSAALGSSIVVDLAFSPDGRWLAAAEQAGSIQLYRVEPTTATHTQTVLAAPGVRNLAFSPDSMLIGAIQADGSGIIWRVGEPSPLLFYGVAAYATTYNLRAFVITLDQQLVAAVRQDDIGFYRISDGQLIRSLPGTAEALALSSAGDALAVTVNGRIVVWGISP